MKYLLLLLCLFLTSSAFSQDSAYTISNVVKVDSVDKKELYKRAKNWFNTGFKNSKEVIQVQDEESGQISGKAVVSFPSPVLSGANAIEGILRYTVTIYVKDGRYKYEITNFTHEPKQGNDYSFGILTTVEEPKNDVKGIGQGWKNKVWKGMKAVSSTEAKSIEKSLLAGMQKQSVTQDW